MTGSQPSALTTTDVVFAIVHTTAATKVCVDKGDLAMARQINAFYTLAAETVRPAGGTVAKLLGDGMLLRFPPQRAREAATALRSLQQKGTDLWQRFDSRCRVTVSVGFGSVVAGPFGPAGEERDDIYGDALNRLFKMPYEGFNVSPEFAQLTS